MSKKTIINKLTELSLFINYYFLLILLVIGHSIIKCVYHRVGVAIGTLHFVIAQMRWSL